MSLWQLGWRCTLTLLVVLTNSGWGAIDLHITEVWPGIKGQDPTEDWIELTNRGTTPWVDGSSLPLWLNDSVDPAQADLITGISLIDPGESVIIVLGDQDSATEMANAWGAALANTAIGFLTNMGGPFVSLPENGGSVALFEGTSGQLTTLESVGYSAVSTGSFDTVLQAESTANNATGATTVVIPIGKNKSVTITASPSLVPEPAPNWLFPAGLVSLYFFNRHRRAVRVREAQSIERHEVDDTTHDTTSGFDAENPIDTSGNPDGKRLPAPHYRPPTRTLESYV